MRKIRFYLLLLLPILFFNCKNESTEKSTNLEKIIQIENIEVLKDSLKLDGNKGVWFYKKQPFSGYSIRYYKNNVILEKVGFYNGKKQGIAKTWFSNGVLKTAFHYKKNMLVGSYKAWWSNGVLQSEVTYVNGKLQGVEQKWFSSGTLAKKRNLLEGKENGLQQAWLKNGALYVNYEAKNGRIFGLRRANSCYNLESEKVIRYDEVKK